MDINREFKLFANSQGIPSTTLEGYTKKAFNKGISEKAYHEYCGGITNLTPNVVEERPQNVAVLDVFSRLMKDRIIWFGTEVNSQVTNIVNAQLLFLENVDNHKEINMYIDSPGGSVIHGLSTVDVMNFVNPDIRTTVAGMAASMGAILLTSGKKGKRQILPHSKTMIHQPSGGMQGKSTDMEIQFDEMKKHKKQLYQILADTTGKDYDQIENDCKDDKWLDAEESKEYGLVDVIVRKK